MKVFQLDTEERRAWYWKATDLAIQREAKKRRELIERRLMEQLEVILALPAVDIFTLERNIERLPSIRPLYQELYELEGIKYANDVVDDLQAKFDAELDRQRIQLTTITAIGGLLAFSMDSIIRSVDNNTKDILRGEIAGLRDDVAGVPELKEKLRNNYAVLAVARSIRVGRTEVARIANFASLEAAIASGLPLQKMWISMRDGRVRATPEWNHVEPDGQVRDLINRFMVSGEQLLFPVDPAGSASNTINCRCVMGFVRR